MKNVIIYCSFQTDVTKAMHAVTIEIFHRLQKDKAAKCKLTQKFEMSLWQAEIKEVEVQY